MKAQAKRAGHTEQGSPRLLWDTSRREDGLEIWIEIQSWHVIL